jgi:hypothetical protein
MYTRRLRLSAPGPAKDGAGLICGSGLHGRATPLKGKGMPPPDNKEADFNAGGIRMVPGVWCHHADTDVLNARRPITAADLAFRPSVRYFASAFASSMKGAAAVVVQEVRPQDRARARALAAITAAAASWGAVRDTVTSALEAAAGWPSAAEHARTKSRSWLLDSIVKSTLLLNDKRAPPSRPCPLKRPQEPEKRMVRRRGAQAPLDGVVHTKRRVHADCERGGCETQGRVCVAAVQGRTASIRGQLRPQHVG